MSSNLVRHEILDETSLLTACDLLHDARFHLRRVELDVQTGTWQGIFVRGYFEDPELISERLGMFFRKISFPLAESVLELNDITSCEVHDGSRLEVYTFNECQSDCGKYRLLFSEDMQIVVSFRERPCGRLRDARLLDDRGSLWTFRNPLKRRDSV